MKTQDITQQMKGRIELEMTHQVKLVVHIQQKGNLMISTQTLANLKILNT